MRHLGFVSGAEELLLIEEGGTARVFSLLSSQFRYAFVNSKDLAKLCCASDLQRFSYQPLRPMPGPHLMDRACSSSTHIQRVVNHDFNASTGPHLDRIPVSTWSFLPTSQPTLSVLLPRSATEVACISSISTLKEASAIRNPFISRTKLASTLSNRKTSATMAILNSKL